MLRASLGVPHQVHLCLGLLALGDPGGSTLLWAGALRPSGLSGTCKCSNMLFTFRSGISALYHEKEQTHYHLLPLTRLAFSILEGSLKEPRQHLLLCVWLFGGGSFVHSHPNTHVHIYKHRALCSILQSLRDAGSRRDPRNLRRDCLGSPALIFVRIIASETLQ